MPIEPSIIGTALSALRKPLEDLYEFAKQEGIELLAVKANAARLQKLRNEIRKVEIVKTLWSMEKGISLYDFYYPQKIEWDGKKKARVGSLDELPSDYSYLIEGQVGQGKSIFLRYLCCEEMRKAENCRIPIFVELRFVDASRSIKDLIFDSFKKLGFTISDELFEIYAKSGQFVLLLDAFDEIDDKVEMSSVKYIDSLSATYPALQIIISSRPDSSLRGLPTLRIVKIQPLTEGDLRPILHKIVKDEALAEEIHAATRASETGVQSLLNTPLLVTLLAIVYQSSQTVPDNVAEFYNKLFEIVFLRHDQAKPGFRRRLATDLSEYQARKLFEAFCFCCLARGLSALNLNEFADCTRIAIQHTGIQADVDDFRHDMTSVASLLHQEGLKFHFIHRSVVEFFTASFVASSSEEFGADFYKKLNTNYLDWRQVAIFLQQVDKYKFSKFFGIRAIEGWAKSKKVENEVLKGVPATISVAQKLLGTWSVFARIDNKHKSVSSVGTMFFRPQEVPKGQPLFGFGLIQDLINEPFSDKLQSLAHTSRKELYAGIENGKFSLTNFRGEPVSLDHPDDLGLQIDVCKLLSGLLDKHAAEAWLEDGLKLIRSTYQDFRKAVGVERGKSDMLDLLAKSSKGQPKAKS